MKRTLLSCFTFLILTEVNAQFVKETSINAKIGYGLTLPYDSADEIANSGFFIQGEYVMKVSSWAELIPYAGFITTSSNGKDINDNPTLEKSETKAVFVGGKTRVRAPIKWVAPYVELGIGASIGKFETFTAFDDIDKSGITYHIPFSFGLELGRNNGFDLGFTYYFMPSVKQFAGAFALGISIPL